ncbi:MAG: aminopeptidase P family protein [Nitrososphaerota archaeon]|nr:aminopeptidase P family protein [Nitrososphaerota archaeon]MDG6967377.1 aminopeptidase P family protein [Nitrososphaerota archaeon]MDG6978455.1 aminopeptidase P family protein [Nitrososphaerota archaeon]
MRRRPVDAADLRKKKIAKLVSMMKREGLDALLLNRIENVRYSTDFRPVVSMWFQNSYLSFITADGEAVVMTVAGDYTRAKHHMPWIGDLRVVHASGRAEEIAKVLRDYSAKKVGYDQLGLEGFHALRKAAKGVQLVDAGEEVAQERAVKLDGEVAIMREASKVTEAAVRAALRSARPGMREYEIAAEGEYAARRLGAEGMSWSLATFAGPNTGLMTRHDSERRVREGEFLILGYATIFKAYNTDITTTTVVGRPSAAQKRLYTATYDAYQAALKAARPGATTLDVRDAAEEVVDEYGYAQYSFSRIQPILHGVGFNVYEPPWAPEPGRDSPSAPLRPGHVIAIEPCITLYDNLKVGGCRIGETILVTESGCEPLTDGKPETHDSLYES